MVGISLDKRYTGPALNLPCGAKQILVTNYDSRTTSESEHTMIMQRVRPVKLNRLNLPAIPMMPIANMLEGGVVSEWESAPSNTVNMPWRWLNICVAG
jgi:hypothetical protein